MFPCSVKPLGGPQEFPAVMRRTLIKKKIHSVELYNDDQIVGVVLAIHTFVT